MFDEMINLVAGEKISILKSQSVSLAGREWSEGK